MKTFQPYKQQRIANKPEFWKGYQERYQLFELGVLLQQARQATGLTQEQVAQRLHTSPTVVAKMENDALDVRLAMLEKFAELLGKKLYLVLD